MSRLETTKEQIKEVVALNNNFPFGMLLGAVVVTVAGAVECNALDCEGADKFAVISGVLGSLFTAVYIFMLYQGTLSEGGETIFSVAFFVSWAVIVGVTTFKDPFVIVGNGFFAAWLGFVSSVGNLVYNVQFASVMKERFVDQGLYICLVAVGSVVVMASAIIEDGCCDGDEVLAVVAGAVSLFFVIIRIVTGDSIQRVLTVFLATWWGILGTIITFGEFKDIGNGFIATWICIIASVAMLTSNQTQGTNWNQAYAGQGYQEQAPDATYHQSQQPVAQPAVGVTKGADDIERMF